MPDPAGLLSAAKLLLAAGSPASLTDAQLRRAISTAYYAVFHKVLGTAAERFAGAGSRATAGYAILYRGFQHADMKKVCEEIDKPRMSKVYRQCLGVDAVSQDMREFANGFANLQAQRHSADYDPAAVFTPLDAAGNIQSADMLMSSFDRTTKDEQTAVLALMLAGARK